MKIFGVNFLSAAYVSLFFGVLLIPATYLLGALLFNSGIGICAAVFMWIDPVGIMTSQKIWMDTTITFFMITGVLLFAASLKSGKNSLFIWSGVACGLAVLTKYTGIFATINIGLFALVHQRDLFRNKFFITSLALPFIMLIPWFFWNYTVYGISFFFTQGSIHVVESNRLSRLYISAFFIGVVVVALKFPVQMPDVQFVEILLPMTNLQM